MPNQVTLRNDESGVLLVPYRSGISVADAVSPLDSPLGFADGTGVASAAGGGTYHQLPHGSAIPLGGRTTIAVSPRFKNVAGAATVIGIGWTKKQNGEWIPRGELNRFSVSAAASALRERNDAPELQALHYLVKNQFFEPGVAAFVELRVIAFTNVDATDTMSLWVEVY